jgi:hypothetical protein
MQKLAIAIAAIAALVCGVRPAGAGTIFGINSGHQDAHTYDGGIYQIDTTTGAATLVAPTEPDAAASINGPNALAYDDDGDVFYYSTHDGADPSLWAYDRATGNTYRTGDLIAPGSLANASFYDGAYWYVADATGFGSGDDPSSLYRVTFQDTAPGDPIAIDSVTRVQVVGMKRWIFGDIAISDDGILYASAGTDGSGSTDFFSIDLATFGIRTVDLIVEGASQLVQLGYSGAELFAIDTLTSKLYSVDPTSGAFTSIGETAADRRFNDAAGTFFPVPEPATAVSLALGLAAIASSRRRARSPRSPGDRAIAGAARRPISRRAAGRRSRSNP